VKRYLFILLLSYISLFANEATDLADKLHFMTGVKNLREQH